LVAYHQSVSTFNLKPDLFKFYQHLGMEGSMMKKTRYLVLRLTIVIGCMSLLFVGGITQASAETFKIGAICAQTGPAAAFGVEVCEGKTAWVKGTNAAGGLKGMKVEIVTLDTETNTITAVNAYRRLLQDNDIRIIWMGTSSTSILAVKPLAAEGGIPMLTGGGNPKIGYPPDPWVYKAGVTSDEFGAGLLNWMKDKDMKTIATISATDAYGQSERDAIKKHAPKFGIQVVAQEEFATSDVDFTAQLMNIKKKNPDLLYSAAAGGPAILVYKAIKKLGLKGQLAVSPAATNAAFFEALGGKKALEGVVVSSMLGSFGDKIPGKSGELWKELSAAVGRDGTYMHVIGYDMGILTEWAVKNSDGTRKGIQTALSRAKDVRVISGPVDFTRGTHNGLDYRAVLVGVYRDGQLVPAD
jgi:branched-chain amino acid transport system substrate-binding protein